MRYLFTTFEGGGHVPPAILMASALKARGHEILFVSDEVNRRAVEATGLEFEPWRTAPNRLAAAQIDDPLQDWRRIWPPAIVRSVCDAVSTGPAARYASDTLRLISAFAPDLVVSNELLLGCLIACDATGTSAALLTGNLWPYPTRMDQPPFGPGWAPPTGPSADRAHRHTRAMIRSWFNAGREQLNAVRADHGLRPLNHTLDQLDSARLIVLGASRAFDYDARPVAPYVYAGPLVDLPAPSEVLARERLRVLISFSTTYQAQTAVMARCMKALAPLPIDVVVTTGPALSPADLPESPNAKVVAWADHDQLVPNCDLMICHGGHGTLVRALRHGVPVLCLPMGRDHPENGRRLTHLGAGLMISRHASVHRIRRQAERILLDGAFKQAARKIGIRIIREQPIERSNALAALESVAGAQLAAAA